MIIIVNLQNTLNPISAAERVKINQNWDELRRGFSSLQNQIAFLSGGEDVDAIIQRIENAISKAENDTQQTIDDFTSNYQQLVSEINQSLSELSVAITNSENAIEQTNEAITNTNAATTDARNAIAELMSIVNDFRNIGEYNATTQYKRNNMVGFDGRTYIALQDNTNTPLTNTSVWNLFADRGPKGDKGDIGETGAALSIQGRLDDPSELPATGSAGQAYTINGELYVWSENTLQWENVGNIKGEKGDTGDVGPQGPPGETPDLTPIQNQLEDHETRIFALENEEVTVKADVSGLNREVAYLKLRQDAADRIEGGTVFADDFNGNRFGFSLDTANSSNYLMQNGRLILSQEILDTRTANNISVIGENFSTAGTATNKVAFLSNGWLLVAVNAGNGARVFVSKDDGQTFQLLCYMTASAVSRDVAICSNGTNFYLGLLINNQVRFYYNLNALTVSSTTNLYSTFFKNTTPSQTLVDSFSMVADNANGIVHIAFSSTNTTTPNSSNIRYTMSNDSGENFSAIENVTTFNTAGISATNPNILMQGNTPVIFCQRNGNSAVLLFKRTGTEWQNIPVSISSVYNYRNPTGIYDARNNYHVCFQYVSESVNYVAYTRSSDMGMNWSVNILLQQGDNPVITYDANGSLFISYSNSGNTYFIKSTDNGINWSSPTLIASGENPTVLHSADYVYIVPPVAQMFNNSVVFNGQWATFDYSPTDNATLVYDLPPTDYVGVFVNRIGNVNVEAYLNDVLMNSELNGNEYSFDGQLNVVSNVKLRLQLSRTNISGGNNDALTRILGGRS